MQEILNTENMISEQIKSTFNSAQIEIKRKKRIVVNLRQDLIPPMLTYVRDYLDFNHLSHISSVDWIEENNFELVYILWSYKKKIQLLLKTKIDRTNPKTTTINKLWPQAETYEREIHEMFGIEFEGNTRLGEFILEDWEDIPPMRKDFDTIKFAQDNFADRREARKDAKNVRETISKHSGEEIPDFAKKYSSRNIDE